MLQLLPKIVLVVLVAVVVLSIVVLVVLVILVTLVVTTHNNLKTYQGLFSQHGSAYRS